MRLITPNLKNFQRALHTLAATQEVPDIPVSTREEGRESRAHPEVPHFRLLLERRDPIPAWSGKISRHSRLISRGGALPRKGERNSRVVPSFPESPRCLSPFQGNLFSLHCLDVQARIDSHHGGTWDSPVGKPRGKASWESLEGKPRGKATDPLIHAKGIVTELLQLVRKAHVHAPSRDED